MHTLFALLCLLGYAVTIVATFVAGLLRGPPDDIRRHLRHISRLGLIAGCAFSIARLLWPLDLHAEWEQAVLAISLAIIMVLRADSEVRRQRVEAANALHRLAKP